jgi:hypothetical protein
VPAIVPPLQTNNSLNVSRPLPVSSPSPVSVNSASTVESSASDQRSAFEHDRLAAGQRFDHRVALRVDDVGEPGTSITTSSSGPGSTSLDQFNGSCHDVPSPPPSQTP